MTAARPEKWLSPQGIWGLVLLALGLMLGIAAAIAPYYGTVLARQSIAERSADLRFLEKKIGAAPRSRLAITADDDFGAMFVAGKTPGLGLAELQRRIGDIAAKSGMTVARAQPLGSGQDDGSVLRMDLEMAGNIQSLRDFLLALETGLPVVFVREARIAAGPDESLVVALQIESYGAWETAAK
jgi:hypothetical protein